MELSDLQLDAIQTIAGQRRVIYSDPPGTRKTATTVVGLAAADAGPTLVVAPLGVCQHWDDEYARWSTRKRVLGTGSGVARARARQEARLVGADLILNYEAARIDIDELIAMGFKGLVLDEAHRVKERDSKTFKALAKIARRSEHFVAVTGTPLLNAAEELWAYLHMIDPQAYSSFWRWAREHFEVEQTTFWGKLPRPITIVGDLKDGHAELLQEELADVMIVRPLEELLPDLPQMQGPMIVSVKLSDAEREMYDSMSRRFWMQDGDKVIYAANEVAKITRLRQLASDWGTMLAEQGELGSKVLETGRLIGQIDGQVLVFTAYRNTAEQIAKLVDGALVTGAETKPQRAREIARFTSGETRVLVGTIGAIGEGVDGLQVAHQVIMVDRDWTPARNEQAIARLLRSGQRRDVVVRYIVAENTVDEHVARALARKQSVIDAVTGGLIPGGS
jgi:non-specific serine/threonine protein kinase